MRAPTVRPRNLVLVTGLVAGVSVGVTGLAWASSPSSSPEHHAPKAPSGPGGGPEDLVTTAPSGTTSTLTVDTPSGSKTFSVNASTTYWAGQSAAQESDIADGKLVWVRTVPTKRGAPQPSQPVAASIQLVPARVGGYVTSAAPTTGASTFTLTDMSGFTRTVKLSTSTTYTEPKTTSPTYTNITTGDFVSVRGTVDVDGTTLDASAVRIGDPDSH